MNVNSLGRFLVTNHSVFIEIVFIGHAVLKCQSSIQRITYCINDSTLGEIGGSIGIYDNSTVDSATYSYVSGSNLLSGYTTQSAVSVDYQYEAQRDLTYSSDDPEDDEPWRNRPAG